MSIKFLGAMIMALQLTTSAYGINYKRLELEADTYQHRIWSRVPSDDLHKAAVYILLEKIREKSLHHLRSLEKLEKYKKEYENTLNEKDANGSLDYFLNIDSIKAH